MTSIDDDPHVARLIEITSWLVMVSGLALTALILSEPSPRLNRVVVNLTVALLGGLTLLLVRHGRRRLAAGLITWGIWTLVMLLATQNGGVRGPSLPIFPAIVVFSGWVLGVRHTQALTGATIAALLLFVWFDARGGMPPPDFANRPAHATFLTSILVLTATVTLVSRRSYRRRMVQAREAAADLAAREAELRKLFQAVEQNPGSIAITDLQGRIEYVNDAFLQQSGLAREQVMGRNARQLSASRALDGGFDAVDQALAQGHSWSGEFTGQRRDGSVYTESVLIAPIRQADGRITHHVELKQDTTEQRRAEAQVHRLSNFDALTGLPNRALLMDRLALLLPLSSRQGHLDALILFNVDRFKNVNDARGHDLGDQLLRVAGERLSALLHDSDVVARLAADEFALLLHNVGTDAASAGRNALAVAERIHADLRQPLQLAQAEQTQVTASLGITLCPQSRQDTPQEVLRRVTNALHRAKESGGGRTAFFEDGMGEAAEHRFQVERELRQAIPAGQLQLYLQSQVDGAGRVIGCEALVRWLHPERGLVPPGSFIPLAEESDLIVALGIWVMQQSLRLVAQQAAAGRRLHISVNVSPRHFSQPDFVAWLQQLLQGEGADAALLTLEVTEGLVINDIDAVIATMLALRALGITLSIDDFGTGYSSLAYLKRLPIQELKIDKTFVQDAPTTADDAALVDIILAVARRMQLRVVAEGVETEAQAQFLRERADGVVYQGYLYGRPEPAEDWIARWRGAAAPP